MRANAERMSRAGGAPTHRPSAHVTLLPLIRIHSVRRTRTISRSYTCRPHPSGCGTRYAPPVPQEDPLLNKGKPAAKRGRKATGQARRLIAGLLREGGFVTPANRVVFRKETTCSHRRSRGLLCLSVS